MNWTSFLISEVETTYAVTARLLEKVAEEDLGWKPATGTNWMTIGQLLKHISNACGAGCKGFVKGDWGLPPGKTIEDLSPEEMMPEAEQLPVVKSVEEAQALLVDDEFLALRMIREAGEEALAHRQIAAPWEPGKVRTLGVHLFRMVQHLDRHKGQLFYYLKLRGVSVSTSDLWG